MDIRKIILEELDSFDWVEDVSSPKVGDRYRSTRVDVFTTPEDKFTITKVDNEFVTIKWDDGPSQQDWTQKKSLDKFIDWINGGTYLPLNESEFEWVDEVPEASEQVTRDNMYVGMGVRIAKSSEYYEDGLNGVSANPIDVTGTISKINLDDMLILTVQWPDDESNGYDPEDLITHH